MNLKHIYDEYNRQSRANIDYQAITDMIRKEAADFYPHFSQEKINYIWSKVYEDHHSEFGDCIGAMCELCYFVDNLPKYES